MPAVSIDTWGKVWTVVGVLIAAITLFHTIVLGPMIKRIDTLEAAMTQQLETKTEIVSRIAALETQGRTNEYLLRDVAQKVDRREER